jgi:DNA-binding NarL/FixJ family response regulator
VEMTIAAMPTTNERPLGTVWIKSTASLVSMGLASALKKRGIHFHRGLRAPQDAAPSVVVFSPEGENELTSGVQDLKEPAPEAAIVVFGASADLSLARAALRAGADGFLHAAMPPEQIARALENAQDGEVVLPRELLGERIKEMVGTEKGPDLSRLGARKVEVLELVAEGLSNAQIAKRLYISESTVKQHLRLAYKALEVKNRNQAAGLLRRSRSQRWVGRKEEVLEKRLALK